MYTNEEIRKKLLLVHEHKMAKDILTPVLCLAGVDAKFVGGAGENGADIIFPWITAPDGLKKICGIQVKKHNIDASIKKSGVTEIVTQATLAFKSFFL